MVSPQRSDSGYRLYSDQDIAVIHWLKTQVDNGMAISQAVAWLEQITDKAGGRGLAVLPGFTEEVATPTANAIAQRTRVRSFEVLQTELMDALLHYDEQRADEAISEAFALYTVEEVGEQIFVPVLVEIGELWHQGEVSITKEHYATNYIMQRLMSLVRATGHNQNAPIIWVGCAPGELHEIGALLLSLYMRRAGYQVHYLGRNLPIDDFVAEVRRKEPRMLLLSAGSREAAGGLRQLTELLAQLESPRPVVGYGGRIFNEAPELRTEIAGVYLGASAEEAVEMVNGLLQHSPSKANTQFR
jgi:methanogenic corrinoid protein MtbC1